METTKIDYSTNDDSPGNENENLAEVYATDATMHLSSLENVAQHKNQETCPEQQQDAVNDRSSSAASALQMKFSNFEIEDAESAFKDVNIVLLQENPDRSIFHQERCNEDNTDLNKYQHDFFIGGQKVPICITELHTVDECLKYAQTCGNKKIFLLKPDSSSVPRLSTMQSCPQISSIYHLYSEGFCTVKKSIDDSSFFKVLLSQLTQLFSWIHNNETMFHPLMEQDIKASLTDIDNDSRMFIIYQLLVEIILKSSKTEVSKKHFIDYARKIYLEKGRFEKDIEEFELSFDPKEAIRWFTRPSFVYRLLSRTCCSNNIHKIFKIRYFISSLHDQLKELHSNSLSRFGEKLHVYRGKVMTNNEFQKIKENVGNLVITKAFLSTTINRAVALKFAGTDLPDGSVAVLFRMIIDTITNQTKPFAYIPSQSCNPDEKEVLISIGTIFKNVLVEQITERVWEVTFKRDREEETLEQTLLGRYFTTNPENQTENISSMVEFLQHHNDQESSMEYVKLICDRLCSFDVTTTSGDSETNENKQIDIIFTEPVSATSSNTQEIVTEDDEYKDVTSATGNYTSTLASLVKTLETQQQTLPSNHPDLGMSYNNIGSLHGQMSEYAKALPYFEKALAIRQQSLPPNHPDFGTSYNNIGVVYDSMGDYPKALSSHEKALAIRQQSLPPNHPDLGTSYNNIGIVYKNMGDYPKALSSYEKALTIRQQSLPPNHPDLGTSYNNIGLVYENMGDYPKALSSHEKALAIKQQSLPPNHLSLSSSYNNIGILYKNMGDYPKALSSYEKALAIRQQSLLPNHPDVGSSYNNIGNVYEKMGNHSKAHSFYERALDIGQQSLPSNHPHLQIYRTNLDRMKKKL